MEKLKRILGNTLLRFPASILCMVMFCGFEIANLHSSVKLVDSRRLCAVLVYGVIMFFIAEIVLENLDKKKYRLVCYLCIYVVLQVSYFFINDFDYYIAFALMMLSVLVFKSKKRQMFELNVANLFMNGIWSGIFSIVLYIGVMMTLCLISFLFNDVLSFKSFFSDVGIFIPSVVFPVIFLNGVTKIGQELKYPMYLEKIVKFIIVPLELIVLGILNIYCVRILVDGTYVALNVNDVFIVVSSMFLISYIFTVMLVTPFKEKLFVVLRKYMVFLILPLICGVFFFAYVNIKEFSKLGLREYFAIKVGIEALISLVLIKIKDSKYQHMIFLLLALGAIIAGFGPLSLKNVVGIG